MSAQNQGSTNRLEELSEKDFEEYSRMLFSAFDANGNGFLDEEELAAMLSLIKGPQFVRNHSMKALIRKYDSNFDGMMSYEELAPWISDILKGKDITA